MLTVAAILTLTVAQLLDLATFMEMVRRIGPAGEQNPLVLAVFDSHGIIGVAIAKLILLAVVTGICAVLLRRPAAARAAATVITVGILAGLLGGITNTAAIGLI